MGLLENHTSVITGCLQGIGRATMRLFAEEGADIIACVYKEDERFSSEVEQLQQAYGVTITQLCFDMSNPDEVNNAVKDIRKLKVPVNSVINIAGITRDAIIPMVTMGQMTETFQVNYFSQMMLSQGLSRIMTKGGGGSIVFTSSITGTDGNVGQLAYGGSKAALISSVKTMAKELGPKGVRVNAVAPGTIRTPMTDAVNDELIQERVSSLALGRIGEPEEVAKVFLYLASNLSSYVTGQVIRIDGGMEHE